MSKEKRGTKGFEQTGSKAQQAVEDTNDLMKIYDRRTTELKNTARYVGTHSAYALVRVYADSLRILRRCEGKNLGQ